MSEQASATAHARKQEANHLVYLPSLDKRPGIINSFYIDPRIHSREYFSSSLFINFLIEMKIKTEKSMYFYLQMKTDYYFCANKM